MLLTVDPEHLRLVAIDIEVDRRVGRREGAEHAAELRVLVGRDQQAAQRLRQRLRVAAAEVLQHVAEPAAGAEADDRRRRERHGACRRAPARNFWPEPRDDRLRRLRRVLRAPRTA